MLYSARHSLHDCRRIRERVLAPDGRVADAKVTCAIEQFNEAALSAVRQWRYAPTNQEDLSYFLVQVPFWP